MNEIETAVRAIAKKLGKHSDKSLHIIVDPDGTFVYRLVSQRILDDQELAEFHLGLLLLQRQDVRAKHLGPGKAED